MSSHLKRVLGKLLLTILVLIGLVVVFIPPVLYYWYRRFIFISPEAVGNNPTTAMVLGAAVYPDDTPSSALQERLDMAALLYKDKKVDRILVSGASDDGTYDEARVMKAELVSLGVVEQDIMEDNRGLRTFESCKRAKNEFQLNKLLVVSQGFHLPRALFLCRAVGIEAYGIYAVGKFSSYHSNWYNFREIGAMYLAIWDIIRY